MPVEALSIGHPSDLTGALRFSQFTQLNRIMSISTCDQILILNEEYGSDRVLLEMILYLSEDDRKDFLKHISRIWQIRMPV